MEKKIYVEDDSGDKNYFTIIPNYVLNHSTAVAQSLYAHLKRLAGENGETFCSRKYLMNKLGITKPTLLRELGYLLEKGWISEVNDKWISTDGGKQKVKSYRVNNLWKLNSDYYEGGKKTDLPYAQGGKKEDHKGVKQGGIKETHKEEPLEEEPYKKNQTLILKKSFTEFENVKLTEEELQKLEDKFGKQETINLMEELGTYIASTGKRYSSHYATLLNWARRKGVNYKSKKITII